MGSGASTRARQTGQYWPKRSEQRKQEHNQMIKQRWRGKKNKKKLVNFCLASFFEAVLSYKHKATTMV